MGNEFEECQSVSKLFKDIKDRTVTFDTEIAPDDRRQPEATHLDTSITPDDSYNNNRAQLKMLTEPQTLHYCACKKKKGGQIYSSPPHPHTSSPKDLKNAKMLVFEWASFTPPPPSFSSFK